MYTLTSEQKLANVREQIRDREAKVRRIQDEINHLKQKERKLLEYKQLNPEHGESRIFSDSTASSRMNLLNQ